MRQHFKLYPKIWGLSSTDRNIDHRRVPNLQVFFTRFGKKLTVSNNATDYKTGDLVTWMIAVAFAAHRDCEPFENARRKKKSDCTQCGKWAGFAGLFVRVSDHGTLPIWKVIWACLRLRRRTIISEP
jgi:hypothetical protein